MAIIAIKYVRNNTKIAFKMVLKVLKIYICKNVNKKCKYSYPKTEYNILGTSHFKFLTNVLFS